MPKGTLVLIIGPSGVGKSVILRALRERHPEYVFPRSATTRQRRTNEGDELYHFMTDEAFSRFIEEGKFLEWAQVHRGARYGTLLSEILPFVDAGRTVVREVDIQGFQSITAHPAFSGPSPEYALKTLFLLPESEEQLIAHITHRAPIEPEELRRRIDSVRHELAFAPRTHVQIRNREGKLEETIRAVEKELQN